MSLSAERTTLPPATSQAAITPVQVLSAPPMLVLHGLLVAALLATGLMGWWQLDVWRAERADDAAARLAGPAVPLGDVLGPDEAPANQDLGVPVVAAGRYLPAEQQFLVAGRDDAGADGYWVLSPLAVDATGSIVLVVRGWTADISSLPPVPAGPVRETGVLQPGEEGSGVVSQGRVVDAVRIPALAGEVDRDLYGAYLLRTAAPTGDPATGLRPVSPPRPDASWSTGLRNLAYGAQWWLFGAFALFMWWRMCVDRLAAARVRTGPPVASPG